MRYPVIVLPFLKVNGITLFPFIFIREKKLRQDHVLMRHEFIHIRQQLELLVLPFYILYLLNYLINLIRYKDHDAAYLHIAFEREAYQHEGEKDYLKHRKSWSWIKNLRPAKQ